MIQVKTTGACQCFHVSWEPAMRQWGGFCCTLARKLGCSPHSRVFADPCAHREEAISWIEQQATPLQWQCFSSSDRFCLTIDKANVELGIKPLPVSEHLVPSKAEKSYQWCLCKVTALEQVLSANTASAWSNDSSQCSGGAPRDRVLLFLTCH